MCVCVFTCVSVCMLSHVQLFATPQTVTRQAPLSVEFSRQEYWSGFPFPTPGDLPDPGIEPASLVSLWQVSSLPPCHLGSMLSTDVTQMEGLEGKDHSKCCADGRQSLPNHSQRPWLLNAKGFAQVPRSDTFFPFFQVFLREEFPPELCSRIINSTSTLHFPLRENSTCI